MDFVRSLETAAKNLKVVDKRRPPGIAARPSGESPHVFWLLRTRATQRSRSARPGPARLSEAPPAADSRAQSEPRVSGVVLDIPPSHVEAGRLVLERVTSSSPAEPLK